MNRQKKELTFDEWHTYYKSEANHLWTIMVDYLNEHDLDGLVDSEDAHEKFMKFLYEKSYRFEG